jgi:hypothetical protein
VLFQLSVCCICLFVTSLIGKEHKRTVATAVNLMHVHLVMAAKTDFLIT